MRELIAILNKGDYTLTELKPEGSINVLNPEFNLPMIKKDDLSKDITQKFSNLVLVDNGSFYKVYDHTIFSKKEILVPVYVKCINEYHNSSIYRTVNLYSTNTIKAAREIAKRAIEYSNRKRLRIT